MSLELVEKAKKLSIEAHKGQVRKSSNKPYIQHPFRVAKILKEAGFSSVVQAAGYSHDTVEDTAITIEDIRRELGEEVADLVASNTETKEENGIPVPWEKRKEHTIENVLTANRDKKALVVADKYANLLELSEDAEIFGEDNLWKSFQRGKEKQYWYFSNVAKNAIANLKNEEIPQFFFDYQEKVESFFKS
jgi:(p)ppGpp synthase/HD superfamily hydrolase